MIYGHSEDNFIHTVLLPVLSLYLNQTEGSELNDTQYITKIQSIPLCTQTGYCRHNVKLTAKEN